MRIGVGIGIGMGANPVSFVASIFQARVLADGGTFEAQSCLDTTISTLQNIDLA